MNPPARVQHPAHLRGQWGGCRTHRSACGGRQGAVPEPEDSSSRRSPAPDLLRQQGCAIEGNEAISALEDRQAPVEVLLEACREYRENVRSKGHHVRNRGPVARLVLQELHLARQRLGGRVYLPIRHLGEPGGDPDAPPAAITSDRQHSLLGRIRVVIPPLVVVAETL